MAAHWTWSQAIAESNLEATTKLVLFVLATHMTQHGENCFPSTITLAKHCSLSERAVITHLEKAYHAGWIRVEKHGYGDRRWARNQYFPVMPTEKQQYFGTELRSVPNKDGTEPRSVPQEQGTERGSNEALNDVQSTHTNINIPTTTLHNARDGEFAFPRMRAIVQAELNRLMPGRMPENMGLVDSWLLGGCDMQLDILPTLTVVCARPDNAAKISKGQPLKLKYFTGAILEARDSRLKPLPEPDLTPVTTKLTVKGGKVEEISGQRIYDIKERMQKDPYSITYGEKALLDEWRKEGDKQGREILEARPTKPSNSPAQSAIRAVASRPKEPEIVLTEEDRQERVRQLEELRKELGGDLRVTG